MFFSAVLCINLNINRLAKNKKIGLLFCCIMYVRAVLLTLRNTLLTPRNALLTSRNDQLTLRNTLLTLRNTLLTPRNTELTLLQPFGSFRKYYFTHQHPTRHSAAKATEFRTALHAAGYRRVRHFISSVKSGQSPEQQRPPSLTDFGVHGVTPPG